MSSTTRFFVRLHRYINRGAINSSRSFVFLNTGSLVAHTPPSSLAAHTPPSSLAAHTPPSSLAAHS